MSTQKHNTLGLKASNLIFYVLLFVLIGVLAYFSRQYATEWDWTRDGRNSLSPATIQMLDNLEQPLKFVAYVPDNQNLKRGLEAFTNKYKRHHPDTDIEFVNPDLEPEKARTAGVRYQGQLSVHLGERSELLEQTQEATVANAIMRMSRSGDDRLVVFVEGHDERDPLATHSQGMSQLKESLERSGFKLLRHHMVRTQSLPDNASFVVLASPFEPLKEGEVSLLKSYIAQGGNLLWLQDPLGNDSLRGLAAQLGVDISENTVVDANQELHQLLGINHPAVVPVVDYGQAAVLKNLAGKQTLFPFAAAVIETASEGALPFERSPLLFSLQNSWLESGALKGSLGFDESTGDVPGPITMGMALSRNIDSNDQQQADSSAVTEQRVVIIGDSDFMLNAFIGQGENFTLATNIFNWLSADDDLLDIPTPKAADVSFEASDMAVLGIAIFFFVLIPLGLLMSGIGVWWWRKRR